MTRGPEARRSAADSPSGPVTYLRVMRRVHSPSSGKSSATLVSRRSRGGVRYGSDVGCASVRECHQSARRHLQDSGVVTEQAGPFEFQAEIVDDPAPGEAMVRFRYVIDDSAELTLSRSWWDDLGRPEVLYVELKPDDDAL